MNFSFIPVNPVDDIFIFPFALNLSDRDGSQLLSLIEDPLCRKRGSVLLHVLSAFVVDLFDLVADDGPDSLGRLLEDGLARDGFDQLVRHGRSLVGVVVSLDSEGGRQLDGGF